MKTLLRWFHAFVMIAFASAAAAQATDEEMRATASAEAWLLVMDTGRFGEAWDGASAGFRGAVAKDAWVKQATAVRTPLGNAKSRKRSSVSSQKNPPGAPPGEYVVIGFDTDFADSSPTRRETVSLFREPDGLWRVAGYFVR